MSRLDWFRTLASTEIMFASDLFGAGVEWSIVTGLSDSESLMILRSVQRKLIRDVVGLVGRQLGPEDENSLGSA